LVVRIERTRPFTVCNNENPAHDVWTHPLFLTSWVVWNHIEINQVLTMV
jgi:uncharacterized membrane protein